MDFDSQNGTLTVSIANHQERQVIYKMLHAIYAEELKQYAANDSSQLTDIFDEVNQYIVVKEKHDVAGFVSITSPGVEKFAFEKYFNRDLVPYVLDERLYEIRLLSVAKQHRNNLIAYLLMYAAMRWVESHGGKFIVCICRSELMPMYNGIGINSLGFSVQSGAVTYELAVTNIETLHTIVAKKMALFSRLNDQIQWKLPIAYFTPAACYHGGMFFTAIGENLQNLDKKNEIINADVLDAWFPPSPKVVAALRENLSWLLQTSPPTYAQGMVQVISQVRGLSSSSILPGAGSSNLIFLSLRYLLNSKSKVLLLDPCYGEYAHLLKNVIHCSVTSFLLKREENFTVQPASLLLEINKGYDLVILVNPNSPTGVYTDKDVLQDLVAKVPVSTLVWIDETYIEYAGPGNSLEQFATSRENVIVCKSMSKTYALSGARAAYLCCSPHLIESLRTLTPPWSFSLPSQLAAITALKDDPYYIQKYKETHVLRNQLNSGLQALGIHEIIPGIANFLLFFIPGHYPCTNHFLENCRVQNLFLRNASNMGESLGINAIRIAVKDEVTNHRMLKIIEKASKHNKTMLGST